MRVRHDHRTPDAVAGHIKLLQARVEELEGVLRAYVDYMGLGREDDRAFKIFADKFQAAMPDLVAELRARCAPQT